MSRIQALMAAVGLALGTVGCATCDTCDDFPAPCTGPNCGFQYGAPAAPVAYAPAAADAAPAPGPATLGPGSDAAPTAPAVNPEMKPAAPDIRSGSPFEPTPPKPTEPSRSGS